MLVRVFDIVKAQGWRQEWYTGIVANISILGPHLTAVEAELDDIVTLHVILPTGDLQAYYMNEVQEEPGEESEQDGCVYAPSYVKGPILGPNEKERAKVKFTSFRLAVGGNGEPVILKR